MEIDIEKLLLEGKEILLLRLDKLHPEISGNKWFKLKYNIQFVKENGLEGMVTFGGAFSNHISAVASAGSEYQFKTVGIIRGEDSYATNPTLSYAGSKGMKLIFVDRAEYRRRKDPAYLEQWAGLYPDYLLVPEGGSNENGIRGASEIARFIPENIDTVCCAVGTGGTMAGLIKSAIQARILGFPALKNTGFLEREVEAMTGHGSQWQLVNHYHEGGYAKMSNRLLELLRQVYREQGIKLDPVYTGKMILGIREEMLAGSLKGKILAIHTGGLQGIAGMEERLGTKIF